MPRCLLAEPTRATLDLHRDSPAPHCLGCPRTLVYLDMAIRKESLVICRDNRFQIWATRDQASDLTNGERLYIHDESVPLSFRSKWKGDSRSKQRRDPNPKRTKTRPEDLVSHVREGGVEPPRPFGHTDLNRARLPIPPLAREAAARLTQHDTPTQTGQTCATSAHQGWWAPIPSGGLSI